MLIYYGIHLASPLLATFLFFFLRFFFPEVPIGAASFVELLAGVSAGLVFFCSSFLAGGAVAAGLSAFAFFSTTSSESLDET
jgi:hypothetical protein